MCRGGAGVGAWEANGGVCGAAVQQQTSPVVPVHSPAALEQREALARVNGLAQPQAPNVPSPAIPPPALSPAQPPQPQAHLPQPAPASPPAMSVLPEAGAPAPPVAGTPSGPQPGDVLGELPRGASESSEQVVPASGTDRDHSAGVVVEGRPPREQGRVLPALALVPVRAAAGPPLPGPLQMQVVGRSHARRCVPVCFSGVLTCTVSSTSS